MRLRPDPGLLSLAGGTVLVGGAPLRLLRLGPRGAALARGWWDGVPVPGRPAAQVPVPRLGDGPNRARNAVFRRPRSVRELRDGFLRLERLEGSRQP